MSDEAEEVAVAGSEEPDPLEEDDEDEYVGAGGATEVKLFGKWSFDDIEVRDISLEVSDASCIVARFWLYLMCLMTGSNRRVNQTHDKSYHDLTPSPFNTEQDYLACKSDHATYLPHTAGRYQLKRFRKASCPIVERLACCLMRKGRNSGKKLMAVRIIQHTLEIIHLLTDQNPIQVVVDAIINSGPRDDSTRVGGAGVVRRQAVDMSPFRRVNYALYLLATGAREASFRNLKTMAECLADELINAARGSSNSYAIKKKDEIERVSKSNR